MKEISNIGQFRFTIRQTNVDWCIPASIEVVTKYLQPQSNVTQESIWQKFERAWLAKNPRTQAIQGISFGSIIQYVLLEDRDFAWANPIELSGSLGFRAFLKEIEDSVDNNVPPIISVPNLGRVSNSWLDYAHMLTAGWHMLTVVAYGDRAFRVHDPAAQGDHNPSQISIGQLKAFMSLTDALAPDSLLLRPR